MKLILCSATTKKSWLLNNMQKWNQQKCWYNLLSGNCSFHRVFTRPIWPTRFSWEKWEINVQRSTDSQYLFFVIFDQYYHHCDLPKSNCVMQCSYIPSPKHCYCCWLITCSHDVIIAFALVMTITILVVTCDCLSFFLLSFLHRRPIFFEILFAKSHIERNVSPIFSVCD